jgi:hypothetical protein
MDKVNGHNVMESSIFLFDLISGKTIISEVINETEEGDILELYRPRVLIQQVTKTGEMAFGMMPWLSDKMELYSGSIVASTADVPKAILDAYMQSTTGLQVASSMPQPNRNSFLRQ